MKHYDFVIVGAGSSGRTAVETLTAEAPGCSVLLLNAEDSLPYKRTSISKNLVKGFEKDAFALHPEEWYAENAVDLINGYKLRRIDVSSHTLDTGNGSVAFSKLLLATGARPIIPFENLPEGNWSALWTVKDGLALQQQFSRIKKLAVIGAGVLGVETAWQASLAGLEVVMAGRDKWPMESLLDRQTAAVLEKRIRDYRVSLMLEREVNSVTARPGGEGVLIKTDGEVPDADFAVIAAGATPEVSLAWNSGIEVNRGILVDSYLKTAIEDIWAAGDCAEHEGGLITGLWHSAENQGRLAALGMLGRPETFNNPPYRLKCEAFGAYWFSGGPVNAPLNPEGPGSPESIESGGITWRARFRKNRLNSLCAVAPSGMGKTISKAAQVLLMNEESRENTMSVLKALNDG